MLAPALLLSLRRVTVGFTEAGATVPPKANVKGWVAEVRSLPLHLKEAFWRKFRQAA
jgi:hypothetical protein